MKYLTLLFPVLLLLSSCHPHIQETETISERGPDSIYAAYLILSRSLPDSLSKIGPYIIPAKDSAITHEMVRDSPYLAIGKLIDATHTFAISCVNFGYDSSVLKIYREDNDQWNMVGRYHIPEAVEFIKYINADGDSNTNEIILSGTGNVNGNREYYVYIYDPHRAILSYAGHFFTGDGDFDSGAGGYKIDPSDNAIKVHYQGVSSAESKFLYTWRDDSLVLLREVMLRGDAETVWLEYKSNKDTSFSAGLTTIFSEKDYETSLHHKKYWDGFFDLK
ncbi:MAG: hypothetical protein JWO03_3565 [Bacteroidetes bacterium]|nr:hypothetical protein [Bacteroidota bacterium]